MFMREVYRARKPTVKQNNHAHRGSELALGNQPFATQGGRGFLTETRSGATWFGGPVKNAALSH
jgi:hypothetical protein